MSAGYKLPAETAHIITEGPRIRALAADALTCGGRLLSGSGKCARNCTVHILYGWVGRRCLVTLTTWVIVLGGGGDKTFLGYIAQTRWEWLTPLNKPLNHMIALQVWNSSNVD